MGSPACHPQATFEELMDFITSSSMPILHSPKLSPKSLFRSIHRSMSFKPMDPIARKCLLFV